MKGREVVVAGGAGEGNGKRLFGQPTETKSLELVHLKTFEKAVSILT